MEPSGTLLFDLVHRLASTQCSDCFSLSCYHWGERSRNHHVMNGTALKGSRGRISRQASATLKLTSCRGTCLQPELMHVQNCPHQASCPTETFRFHLNGSNLLGTVHFDAPAVVVLVVGGVLHPGPGTCELKANRMMRMSSEDQIAQRQTKTTATNLPMHVSCNCIRLLSEDFAFAFAFVLAVDFALLAGFFWISSSSTSEPSGVTSSGVAGFFWFSFPFLLASFLQSSDGFRALGLVLGAAAGACNMPTENSVTHTCMHAK